ncbi:uncharacterized protein LOC125502676 [Dendroctonus ponderosae]|uniref:uncharacterized protein LOC125502676 n=1 Tax=Dendroctonus ponderosae TaxID=77166 RepID=UPI002034FADC|nr:uncharacterized protein LOC125502676 [Dendroctonus ponderosae]
MHRDIESMKAKMSSLLSSFGREITKIKTTTRTGQGQKNVYSSKWFAFTSFAFLMNKNEEAETINTETVSTDVNDFEAVSEHESKMDISQIIEYITNETGNLEKDLTSTKYPPMGYVLC